VNGLIDRIRAAARVAAILGLLVACVTGCGSPDTTEFGPSSPRHGLDLPDKVRVAAGAVGGDGRLFWLNNGSAVWYVQTSNIDDLTANPVPLARNLAGWLGPLRQVLRGTGIGQPITGRNGSSVADDTDDSLICPRGRRTRCVLRT
jgi:hypothetical protein